MRGREFGDAIRALLRASNLTNRAAADLLGWQEAKVSELINGKEGTTVIDLAQLLGLLRTPRAEFDHLMALFAHTHEQDWLQPAAEGMPDRARTLRHHEKIAKSITGWSMNVVHGLVQVPSYSAHLVAASTKVSADERPSVIQNRAVRQEVALDGHRTVTIFMHENALRFPVGDEQVMRDQLHHLLRVSVRSFLTMRVIPLEAGPHAGLAGDFDLLKFNKIPPIVYLESEGANVFLEDQPSVALYDKVVASLGRTALDEKVSRKLITDMIGEEAYGEQVAQEQLQRE